MPVPMPGQTLAMQTFLDKERERPKIALPQKTVDQFVCEPAKSTNFGESRKEKRNEVLVSPLQS
ncbi:hypothetical protein JR316_0008217 [Psilocybe cubensis]|uniref:Uncharacterized protein n=1 Tax=Psilocybe cubensis TaxID=181762 RepID=A0ACB8GW84_PSICU|nr:hypothetical protein JR316_0008217 [Psilocybe cubensis]KAH9479622.1 hypothetical protein JR316_0008217 [Psilocybe cubensis]